MDVRLSAEDGLLPVALHTPNVVPAIDFYRTHDGGLTWSSTAPLPYAA